MRSLRLLLSCLCLLAATISLAQTPSATPLHFSLTEATYNQERGRLLLTVRLQTADLEAALSAQAQHKVSASEPGDLAPLALDYVREKLRVTPPKGQTLRLDWAGHDVADKQIFLFFEAPLTGSIEGLRISNTLLLERLPDQVNALELREGAARKTLVFSRDKTELTVTTKP